MDLAYPINKEKDIDAFADIIDGCAASRISQNDLKEWFEQHKIYLED